MKIPLILANNEHAAYTFNADDYMKIRRDYRISGKLIGIPVSHNRNHSINGLPALFNKYEVHLLISLNAVHILEKQGLLNSPSESATADFQQMRQRQLAEQNVEYRRRQIENAKQMFANNQSGIKKQKSKNKKRAALHLEPDYDSILKAKIEQIENQEIQDPLVQVPTEHPVNVDTTPLTLPPLESLEFRVYRDLWQRGKYLTTGETFGGHFLVYPGDPLHFHASHIIHIVQTPLTVKQMVSYGRVSVIVNKSCVFATENEAHAINYQHMQWEGNQLLDS